MEREVTLLGSKDALMSMLTSAMTQLENDGDAMLYIPGNVEGVDLTLRCEILDPNEPPIAEDGVIADFG